MNRAKKSFAAPSAKPCDVEYRLRRLQERMTDTLMFFRSIDPSVYPAEYAAVSTVLEAASKTVFGWKPPAKKARKSPAERATAAALAAANRAEKAAARAAAKAEKTAAKAEPKAKVKTVKVKTELKADVRVAKPAGNSAIERALAAAKARKAAKAATEAA